MESTRYDACMFLFKPFINLCLFRGGPADIPASSALLRLCLIMYFSIGVLVSLLDHSLRTSLAAALADTILLVIVCWVLLRLRKHSSRYRQTLTAMAGAGALIGVVGWPVLWVFRAVEPQAQMTSLALLPVVIIILWSLAVTAQILRQALDIGPSMAVMITVGYTFLSLIIVRLAMAGVA